MATSSFSGSSGKNLPPDTIASDASWTLPLIGAGVKTNDAYTDGNIFLTLPVWSTIGRDGKLAGDYLFIEPYASVGEGGEVATSLGLAWRHLFSHESMSALQKKGSATFMEEGWFVGANVFVDMLDTQHHNSFWQLGVGAEIGNRYVELRGNYYIPLTGEQLAQRNVSERSFTTSSTRYVQSGSGYGDPYATANQITQDVNLTTSAITTYRTTTVRTVTEIFEKGMEGWDAELAVLVPGLDEWMDVRLIGGYFSFDNQPFGPQSYGTGKVHGWKAGVEVRPVPAVVLTGMWYEDKRLTGGNWMVGVQLQVPLDRTWRDAFRPRRRHLVEHLAEPVHRQNDAIKVGNKKQESSSARTSLRRVTRVVSQEQGHIVLADDIIFVNNGPAVGNGIQAGNDATGDGTAEKPVASVQAGANIAGVNNTSTGRVWNVYTQGGGATGAYAESVTFKGSTNFISSFTPITGQGGKIFGGDTTRPLVQGGFIAQNIPNVGITGYEITTGLSSSVISAHAGIAAGQGVFLENFTNGLVKDSDIHNASRNGIYAEGNGSLVRNLKVTNSTISNNGDHGMVASSFDTATTTFTVDGNTFSDNGLFGFASSAMQSAVGNFVLTRNTVSGNANFVGVWTYAANSATANVTMTGNTVKDQPGDGVYLKALNSANIASASISGNRFVNTANQGVRLESNDSSSMTATVTQNDFNGAGGDYIHSDSNGSSTLNLTANNNTLHSAIGVGIRSTSANTSTTTLVAAGNTISDQDGQAILSSAFGGSTFNATITGNTIVDPGYDGIYLTASGTGTKMHIIALDDNTITRPGAASDGIFMSAGSGATLTADSISGNTITGVTGVGASRNGMTLASSGTGSTFTATLISGNTIADSGKYGMIFDSTGTGSTLTAGNVSGNTITGSVLNGIKLNSTGTSTINTTLNTNTITGSLNEAIRSESYNAGSATGITLTATNNTIGVVNGWIGINMLNYNASVSTLTATGNTITGGVGGFGIYHALFANISGSQPGLNASILTATVSGNTITGGTGFNGLAAQANELSKLTAGFNNNTITTGDNGQGIVVSTNVPSSNASLTIGGNVIKVGSGSAKGIHLDPNSIGGLKVNVGITPVDNTVTRGAGFFLNSTGGGTFGAGSQIKINGSTYTLPTSF